MQACSKLFHSTLQNIKDKIEPVINTNLYQDNCERRSSNDIKEEKFDVKSEKKDKDKDNKDSQSRWESTSSSLDTSTSTSSAINIKAEINEILE